MVADHLTFLPAWPGHRAGGLPRGAAAGPLELGLHQGGVRLPSDAGGRRLGRPGAVREKLAYLRDGVYASRNGMELAVFGLVFTDDSNDEEYSAAGAAIDLKPDGAEVEVTEENKAEYLQLFAEHRLVGAIQPQVCLSPA